LILSKRRVTHGQRKGSAEIDEETRKKGLEVGNHQNTEIYFEPKGSRKTQPDTTYQEI